MARSAKRAEAVAMVYDEDNSVVMTAVHCPVWCHKYIIGKKGVDIKAITSDIPEVYVEFDTSSRSVKIEGPKQDTKKARRRIEAKTKELLDSMCVAKIDIPAECYKYIIGKAGANIKRINTLYSVSVQLPASEASTMVTIEGLKEGVLGAKEELLKIKNRRENYREIIIESRFHGRIIGTKGRTITKIRQEFGQVQIVFPQQGEKSDVVKVRGEKDMVDKVCKHLQELVKGMMETGYQVHDEFDIDSSKVAIEESKEDVEKARKSIEAKTEELVDSMYVEELDIPTKCYKHIIGKAGANINRIKSQYSVSVQLPANEASTMVKIEGPKEGVLGVREELLKLKNRMDNEEREIIIESRFHGQIIGTKGKAINKIRQEFGQVQIVFPQQDEKSDVVKIRGKKDMVKKAHKHLQKLVAVMMETGHQERVSINKQQHKFIISDGEADLRKIRNETNTRIDLPDVLSESSEIVITGRKEDVLAARKRIQKIQNIVQMDMNVPNQFHNTIIGPRERCVRAIMEECGEIQITFPAADSLSSKVTIRGPKANVKKAERILTEMISRLLFGQ